MSSHASNYCLIQKGLERELQPFMNEALLFVLSAPQLSILNQTFRPIMCGTLVELTSEYAVFKSVNIRMSSAPEYIFPTPLIIPLMQIAWFMPFDYSISFSLY